MAWNPGQELFGRRYIIERKLGEDGVGITYLAKNQGGELRATGKEIRTLTGHSESVSSVAISSDGQILASGGDKTIKLSNLATGSEIRTFSHSDSVISVACSPDGNWLAAGDYSGNIKIWRRS